MIDHKERPMNMKQMKKLYRHEHSTRGICPTCCDKKEVRDTKRCCAGGTIAVYGVTAPGLRAFARGHVSRRSVCVGKLATIVGS